MKRKLICGTFADGSKGTLLVEGGCIAALRLHEFPDDCETLDFGDQYILPAFVEIHAHGGAGYDFIDNTSESFEAIMDAHLSHGVASLCPTLCACDFAALVSFLELCEKKRSHPGFLGVHLEGPFLSPDMCGAQNLSCLRDPSVDDIEALVAHSGVLARITVAPELAGAAALTQRMKGLGVHMSVGHTAIDAAGFARAREMGINGVTHLYSSMRGRHKVGSYVIGGLIEAALADDDCYVELIGDGHHVSRENLLLTLKCKGADKVALVSDAMRGAGQTSPFSSGLGESYLGAVLPENRVILEDGVAKLPDRSSFAGSLAIGDTMVQALVGRYGLPLSAVSQMMSKTPARLLGLHDRGELAVGMRADVTVLDRHCQTSAVLREGEIVYRKDASHA